MTDSSMQIDTSAPAAQQSAGGKTKKPKKPKDESKIRKPTALETKTYEAHKQTQARILSMYGGTLDSQDIKFEELDPKPFLSFYNDGQDPCLYLKWTSEFNTLPKSFLEPENAKYLPRIMFPACRNAYQVFKLGMSEYENKLAAFTKSKQEKDEVKAQERLRKRKEREDAKAADKDSKPKKAKKASDVVAALIADNSPILGVPVA